MGKIKILSLLFCILISNLVASSSAQNCSNYSFSRNAIFATCLSLPVLNSHLHWNYNPANGTVDLAFRHTGSETNQWVAYALNLAGSGMIGAQALVAVTSANGSVRAYTSPVTGYGTSLQPGPLSFDVPELTVERVNGVVVVYATLTLPRGNTSFNHVWQVGPVGTNGALGAHAMDSDNRNSLGVVDFSTTPTGSGDRNTTTSGDRNTTPSPSSPTPSTSTSQSCGNFAFSNNANYATCVSLAVLSSNLHWNYNPANGTVDLAFRHTGSETNQWVAYALNVGGRGMIGAQALVALITANGSVRAYTSPVTSYSTGLQPGGLSFDVPVITAERVNGDVMIYATVVLPSGMTSFNHVWQVGPVSNGAPVIHALGSDNRNSVGQVDFSTGLTSGGGSVGGSRLRRRNTHGVLNAVSWGVMMPMGAMAARYLKVFNVANPAWFYIHVTTQTSAYIVGVAGWVTGLKLGSDSAGVRYDTHRNIGITLFAIATLQVFALLLRPKPDNKYRFYWNIYHHSLGYSIIIMSIINVYEGLDILDPEKKWKNAYTGILISLGVITVISEAFTWYVVLKRKQENKRTHAGTNGANGHA
ncbi:hypothetical protein SSX86_024169 [Deinandra increscens subsp. villosa]|uniref:Cytochrome b561 and DOMON domain-containing protein n=1 Tax=Deinandra increscens subsp. villosa TaxID=3103831 RepID=A0AAP0GPE8_9ASTR